MCICSCMYVLRFFVRVVLCVVTFAHATKPITAIFLASTRSALQIWGQTCLLSCLYTHKSIHTIHIYACMCVAYWQPLLRSPHVCVSNFHQPSFSTLFLCTFSLGVATCILDFPFYTQHPPHFKFCCFCFCFCCCCVYILFSSYFWQRFFLFVSLDGMCTRCCYLQLQFYCCCCYIFCCCCCCLQLHLDCCCYCYKIIVVVISTNFCGCCFAICYACALVTVNFFAWV